MTTPCEASGVKNYGWAPRGDGEGGEKTRQSAISAQVSASPDPTGEDCSGSYTSDLVPT